MGSSGINACTALDDREMSEIRVARKQFDLKSIQVIRQIKKCYKDYDMMDLFEDVIAERIMKDKLKILKREVSKFKSEKKLEGRYKHPLQISKFLLNFCDKLLTPSKSYLKRFAKNLILQDEDPFTLKKAGENKRRGRFDKAHLRNFFRKLWISCRLGYE